MTEIRGLVNVRGVVSRILHEESKKTTTDFTPKDATTIAPLISTKVEAKLSKDVNSVITNLTNQEPWYRSRVIVGTGVSLLSFGARFAGLHLDVIDQSTITQMVLDGATILGSAYALYGRLVVNKPMGE